MTNAEKTQDSSHVPRLGDGGADTYKWEKRQPFTQQELRFKAAIEESIERGIPFEQAARRRGLTEYS